MRISGKTCFIIILLQLLIVDQKLTAQRFNPSTSTDCGNINIKFGIQGGLEFCEGDTITLINTTDSTFDYYIIDWSEGKLDTVYDKRNLTHVFYFPDSVLCKAAPLAVYFLGVKSCKVNKQTRVWGAYGINHIYRPLADFDVELDSVCYGHDICMKSKACNADSIVWNYNDELITMDSCYSFITSGTKKITMMVFNKCASDTVTKSFTIVDLPSVKVNVSNNVKNNSVCKGDTVTFVNQSNKWSHTKWTLPPFNKQQWMLDTSVANKEFSLPYDTIIYLDTIKVILLDTGLIKFRLLSFNPCDSITWDYNLQVVEPAIIQFNIQNLFCETADFTPSVNIIGVVDKYSWQFPGGTPATSNLSTPSNVHYSVPGTYMVYLRATNSCGTTLDSVQIHIDAKLNLQIDSIINPICRSAGLISLHANLPNGSWNGIGINPQGFVDPLNLSVGAHDYFYSLQSGGCLLLDTIRIIIVDTTPLVFLPTDLCVNTLPLQLKVNPPGGLMKGPGINAFGEFDPALTGLGRFDLIYEYTDINACKSIITSTVTVNPAPLISGTDSLFVCIGNASINLIKDLNLFTNPPGGQYSFSINGKPVNPIINTSTYKPGIYTLQIHYVLNLCSIDDSAKIILTQIPLLQITRDTVLCTRETFFQLNANFKGGFWSGPAVNTQSGLVDVRGITGDSAVYTYTYESGSSCETIQQCIIYIDDKGKGINAGLDIDFCRDSNQILQLKGFNPSGGHWKGRGFLDDSLGILALNQFADDTIHYLSYCIDNNLRSVCTFCDTVQLLIHSLPDATFDISGSACLNMNFTVKVRNPGPYQYDWDFGDGTVSNLISPLHSYSDTGIHYLKLRLKNAAGCIATWGRFIQVTTNPPVAKFTLDSLDGCAPFNISINDQSGGDNIRYTWKIADLYFYDTIPQLIVDGIPADSIIKIKLTVANGCGIVSDSALVTVRPKPLISFGIDNLEGCTPLTVRFANASTGNATNYEWDLGNGVLFTGADAPAQTYTTGNTPTKYLIKLKGNNACGTDSITREIIVNPADVLAFIETSQPDICQFDSLLLKSFSTPGSKINWTIIHPSGLISSSNQSNTNFQFNEKGEYLIILHAIQCGEDFDTIHITVYPAPEINFELPIQLCLNDTAFFENKSSDIGNSEWNFGDGSVSQNTHGSHVFTKPGKYKIKLTGFSKLNNCPYFLEKDLTIIDLPHAIFTASKISGCAPLEVDFTSQSVGANKYLWTFSDNSSSSLITNPTHVFKMEGNYKVILEVLDTNQCSSDTALLIKVNPTPFSQFSTDQKEYCEGADSVIVHSTSLGADSYDWLIGSTQFNVLNPSYFPQDTGLINIQLVTSNIYLCRDTSYAQIRIKPSPRSDFFLDKDMGCVELKIRTKNFSANADNFIWEFGDKNTSTQNEPSHIYKTAGQYSIKLISLGSNNCPPDTLEKLINVWPLPDAGFIIERDSLCGVPMHIHFKNNSAGSKNYVWKLDDKIISLNTETDYLFDELRNYKMQLIVNSEYSCLDSTESIIPIYRRPVADFIMDSAVCENHSIKLSNTSRFATEFEWDIESIGLTNEMNPLFQIEKAGVYNVRLIASYNSVCRDTLFLQDYLKVYNQPEADFSYTIDVDKNIAGDIQFDNLSTDYTTQKWLFGDGQISYLDDPLHIYATGQVYDATLFVYHFNSGLFTCLDSISRKIGPLIISTFFAPNAISPEYGDAGIRIFKPVGLGLKNYEIAVYSPWGERVWFSTALDKESPSESWDGTYQGNIVPQGAYTWMAKLQFLDGSQKIARGTISVLR